jgi:hypothetical protein
MAASCLGCQHSITACGTNQADSASKPREWGPARILSLRCLVIYPFMRARVVGGAASVVSCKLLIRIIAIAQNLIWIFLLDMVKTSIEGGSGPVGRPAH